MSGANLYTHPAETISKEKSVKITALCAPLARTRILVLCGAPSRADFRSILKAADASIGLEAGRTGKGTCPALIPGGLFRESGSRLRDAVSPVWEGLKPAKVKPEVALRGGTRGRGMPIHRAERTGLPQQRACDVAAAAVAGNLRCAIEPSPNRFLRGALERW